MVNIKLLFIILDEGYDKKVNDLLNKFGIKVKTASGASGTATSGILNYLGLYETKKTIFMAIIPDYLSEKILAKIKVNFNLEKEGTGIAFTIQIVSANKYLSDSFKRVSTERDELKMNNKEETKYHLVITIVSEGYLEQVMEAAKKAGSSGGTAIKGRGLSNVQSKILGFNIEPEKDIVLNIVLEKNKTKVMEEITKAVGIKTPGKGVCVALPVDEAVGIEFFE
ncbi:MAG: hypothetical protein E7173_03495 [Firmicutes bacterium]|nr:hypothetical protein [Bacillota bacterium]